MTPGLTASCTNLSIFSYMAGLGCASGKSASGARVYPRNRILNAPYLQRARLGRPTLRMRHRGPGFDNPSKKSGSRRAPSTGAFHPWLDVLRAGHYLVGEARLYADLIGIVQPVVGIGRVRPWRSVLLLMQISMLRPLRLQGGPFRMARYRRWRVDDEQASPRCGLVLAAVSIIMSVAAEWAIRDLTEPEAHHHRGNQVSRTGALPTAADEVS